MALVLSVLWESLEAVERNVLPEMTAGKRTHTGQPVKVRVTLAAFRLRALILRTESQTALHIYMLMV